MLAQLCPHSYSRVERGHVGTGAFARLAKPSEAGERNHRSGCDIAVTAAGAEG